MEDNIEEIGGCIRCSELDEGLCPECTHNASLEESENS